MVKRYVVGTVALLLLLGATVFLFLNLMVF